MYYVSTVTRHKFTVKTQYYDLKLQYHIVVIIFNYCKLTTINSHIKVICCVFTVTQPQHYCKTSIFYCAVLTRGLIVTLFNSILFYKLSSQFIHVDLQDAHYIKILSFYI